MEQSAKIRREPPEIHRSVFSMLSCLLESLNISDSMSIDDLFVYSGLGWSPVGVVPPSLMAHDRVAFPEHEGEQSIFPSWRVR